MKLLIFIVFGILEHAVSFSAENDSDNVLQLEEDPGKPALTLGNRMKLSHENSLTDNNPGIKLLAGVNEYFFLINSIGKVYIINATDYTAVITYDLPAIVNNLLVVSGDTFYRIDTIKGAIYSTLISNILQTNVNLIVWTQTGSCPPEAMNISGNVAVSNDSLIYFTTYRGILYVHDPLSKSVTKLAELEPNDPYASLIFVGETLYIHKSRNFFSFDGDSLKLIDELDVRTHPGLFKMGKNVCVVGGSFAEVNPDPVYCYNPETGVWTIINYINETRYYPAVAATESKTLVFGGLADYNSTNIVDFWRSSIEVLNHETNVWSYALTPFASGTPFSQALSISI